MRTHIESLNSLLLEIEILKKELGFSLFNKNLILSAAFLDKEKLFILKTFVYVYTYLNNRLINPIQGKYLLNYDLI